MSQELKISLIGAGSPTFTPFLFKRILEGALPNDNALEVSLMDVDPKTLDMMSLVLEKILRSFQKRRKDTSLNIRITKHTKLREALEGASFVVTTVGVGGLKATLDDINIPARYGIFQSIGDTVGPGGIFRGLRHIPVILNVARTMEDVCPEAYLFNYTNPMTPVTRSVRKETKIKDYGLCTSVWHTLNFLSKYFGTSQDEVDMTIAGINHLCFIVDLKVKGASVSKNFGDNLPKKRFGKVCREIYDLFGLAPYAGDRHTSEFFPQLYARSKRTLEEYGLLPNMLTVLDLVDREPVGKMLKQVALGKSDVEKLLATPGWEEEGIGVVKIMESLTSGESTYFAGINLPNDDLIDNLPRSAIVEVPAMIGKDSIKSRKIAKLPDDIAAILTHRIAQYELLVDAAITGDRGLLLRSFQMDGYIKSLEQGRRLMNSMLRAEKRWLPSSYWFKNGHVS
jgi:alpha-galactosidase